MAEWSLKWTGGGFNSSAKGLRSDFPLGCNDYRMHSAQTHTNVSYTKMQHSVTVTLHKFTINQPDST